ncbi:MAG: SDR family NAD(P)-dependent oxidoreductase [Ancrocorticia sp.]
MAAGETNLEISGGAGNTLPSSGRILVTGASRGIGRHIAVGLARPRRTLILVARTLDALEDVASECEDRGAKVCTIACQLENHDRLTHMLDIVKADGGADMVVNCAGIFGEEKLPWETDPDLWWQTQLVNVRAPYLIQHALVPGMLERGGGRILDLSSGAAIKDRDDSSGYYVSKTALMRLGGCLHEAGYARGLRVLEMAPGVVLTDMTRDSLMHKGRTDWTDPADSAAIVAAFADGELDGLSGCQVRAGADSLDELRARSKRGIGDDERRLRLSGWAE